MRCPAILDFAPLQYLWLFAGLALTLNLLLGTNPASASGPRLWLGCCGIYFQPSEPLKLLLIVYLAAYLADRLPLLSLEDAGRAGQRSSLLPLLLPTLLVTSLTLSLLLVQRDLGTASIFLFIYAVMVYLATRRVVILLIAGLTLAAAAIAGSFLFDVVNLRINAWLNPWVDPSGRSTRSSNPCAGAGKRRAGRAWSWDGVLPWCRSPIPILFCSLERKRFAGSDCLDRFTWPDHRQRFTHSFACPRCLPPLPGCPD
jgi:hypothetical protein